MTHSIHLSSSFAAWVLAVCAAGAASAAEAPVVWEAAPYRIRVELAIDAPGELAELLAAELPSRLEERVHTAIGAPWRVETEVVTGAARQRLLRGLDQFSAGNVVESAAGDDKQLLVVLRATPWGYALSAREFDHYLRRWGPTLRRMVRQRDALAEQLFELTERAIAPLARLRADAKDPQLVALDFRGADLPASGPDFAWVQPGDVLEPAWRRTNRDGSLAEAGVTAVPWTYVEAVAPPKNGATKSGRLRSVSPRPLGVRRGRVEQVAIALRHDPGDTTLELRSRRDRDKPLIGYEVLAQDVDDQALRPLGASDAAGDVTISPGKSAVQFVVVKSDGVTLARVPVVPGAEPRLTIPLPDDDVRQRAAARLAAFREDVVDLVARRTILIARIRRQIEEQNFDAARELLTALDELPGPSQLNLALDREAQRLRTDDVQVQRRIDRLFSQTRTVLGKFLDPQAIGKVREEFQQAQQRAQESKTAGDKQAS